MNHLKTLLDQAIEAEDYEAAAALRDRIAAGEVVSAGLAGAGATYWNTPMGSISATQQLLNYFQSMATWAQEAEKRADLSRYHSEGLQNEQDRILEIRTRSRKFVQDQLISRIRRKYADMDASWVAHNVLLVTDHRDNTERYVVAGECLMTVRYSTSGFTLE